MKRIIEHELVNWVDGMKIAKRHLQQTEDFFIDNLCDNMATRLTNYNYGLLPTVNKNEPSSDLQISEQAIGRVEIRLIRCHAITSGGYRINYEPKNDNYMMCDFSLDVAKKDERFTENKDEQQIYRWDIILGVNPFNRQPIGEPDADENPPRHPNVIPAYKLSVMPMGQINPDEFGMYHLVIGRILYDGQKFEVDRDFIPPCTSMSGHSALLEYYEQFSKYMASIERSSKEIILKVQNIQKTSDVAENINLVCKEIMRYISIMYFSYRNIGRFMEPVKIVNYFSTMAHVCLSALSFMSKKHKEEMLQYFYAWNNIKPGEFESIISEASGILYKHNDIRNSMLKIEHFLSTMSILWENLSKLEYVGQSKDNVVVTVKSAQQDVVSTNWSVID